MSEKRDQKTVDIYGLLLEASKTRKHEKRTRLLQSIDVREFFEEGSIKVDMRTCKGVECKLCIKACPTNALYWKAGEIGVAEDLCVYCTSCVLNCTVDNCIRIERKRPNGGTERFGNPIQVCKLLEDVNACNRKKTIESVFPDQETYLKKYRKPFFATEEEEK